MRRSWIVAAAGLLLALGSAASANVLIVGDNGLIPTALQDTQSKLAATGRLAAPIDTFDVGSGTPTLATLQGYSSVLLGHMWSVADPTALGNVLADYVDGGGGVVATFCLGHLGPQGRWMADAYDPIIKSGINTSNASISTIHVPGHPVLDDVSVITTGFRWPGYHLHPQATPIADWLDQYGATEPMIAELGIFAGHIVSLNMVSYSTDANVFTGWTGDAAILMANALNYVAAQSSIPEPASLTLLALGGASLLRARRRRKPVTAEPGSVRS